MKVAGLDIGSIHSAVTVVEVELTEVATMESAGHTKPVYHCSYAEAHERPFLSTNNFTGRYQTAVCMRNFIQSFPDVKLCVVEDYINASFSRVAFSLAELNGITRALLHQEGYTLMLITPERLRKFLANTTDEKFTFVKGEESKTQMMELTYNAYGFKSHAHLKKERSDCTDAFGYAIIGACAYNMAKSHVIRMHGRQMLIFYNPNKNGLLDDTKRWFVPRRT